MVVFFFVINIIRLGVYVKKMLVLEFFICVMVVFIVFSFVWVGYDYVMVILEGMELLFFLSFFGFIWIFEF